MNSPGGPMPISKTQRWLDLIAFLVKRHFPVPVDEIMEGVPAYAVKWRTEDDTARATVRRMFERDKDELRAAGIPLETVDYLIDGVEVAQGYRISGRDFYLPYLRIVSEAGGAATAGAGRSVPAAAGRPAARERAPSGSAEVELTAEEASLAIDALRRVRDLPASPFAAEALSALAKLAFDLDPALLSEQLPADDAMLAEPLAEPLPIVREATYEPGQVLYVDRYGTGGVRELLQLLTDAVRARKRVRFRYHGIHRGEATDRDVAPYGLLYQHGQWYLVGDDATRGAIRVFRLGRMEDAVVEDRSADPQYDVPADFDIATYARREPWELGEDEPLTCEVRFEFPLSLWADRNGHGERLRELTGGAVVRRFDVRQTDPFLRWLQSFGGDAVVVAPAELRRAQAEMARETLEAYGG